MKETIFTFVILIMCVVCVGRGGRVSMCVCVCVCTCMCACEHVSVCVHYAQKNSRLSLSTFNGGEGYEGDHITQMQWHHQRTIGSIATERKTMRGISSR